MGCNTWNKSFSHKNRDILIAQTYLRNKQSLNLELTCCFSNREQEMKEFVGEVPFEA